MIKYNIYEMFNSQCRAFKKRTQNWGTGTFCAFDFKGEKVLPLFSKDTETVYFVNGTLFCEYDSLHKGFTPAVAHVDKIIFTVPFAEYLLKYASQAEQMNMVTHDLIFKYYNTVMTFFLIGEMLTIENNEPKSPFCCWTYKNGELKNSHWTFNFRTLEYVPLIGQEAKQYM